MKKYNIIMSILLSIVLLKCSNRVIDYQASNSSTDLSSTQPISKMKGTINPNIEYGNTTYYYNDFLKEGEYQSTPEEFLHIGVCHTREYGEKDFDYFYRDVKMRLFVDDSEVNYTIKKAFGCKMSTYGCICIKLEPEIDYKLPLNTKMRIDFDIGGDLYLIGPARGLSSIIMINKYSIYLNNTSTPDVYSIHITKPYYTKTTGIGFGFSQGIVADINAYVEITLIDGSIKKAYMYAEEYENTGWTIETTGLAFEYNGDDIIPEEISTIKIIGKIKDRYEDKVSEVIEYKPDSKMWIPVKHEDPKNRYEPYMEYLQTKCIKEFYFVK